MAISDVFAGFGDILTTTFGARELTFIKMPSRERFENINGYKKEFEQVIDPVSGETQMQSTPHFRISGLPFPEDQVEDAVVGCMLIDKHDNWWRINAAASRASGIVNCYVTIAHPLV